MKIGPVYVSQSTRRRSRRPSPGLTQAQLAAQAGQRAAAAANLSAARRERHARYGPWRPADPRTWHTAHSVTAVLLLVLVFALPAMLGDGPVAGLIWGIAVVGGLIAWAVWLAQLHSAQAPARRAASEQRRQAAVMEAHAAAQARAAHQQYLAPRQIGSAWHHGACTTNHRSYDTALRCRRGGT